MNATTTTSATTNISSLNLGLMLNHFNYKSMKDCVVEIEQSFDLSLENDRFNGLVKSGDYATIKRVVDFVEYYKTVTVKSKHIFSIGGDYKTELLKLRNELKIENKDFLSVDKRIEEDKEIETIENGFYGEQDGLTKMNNILFVKGNNDYFVRLYKHEDFNINSYMGAKFSILAEDMDLLRYCSGDILLSDIVIGNYTKDIKYWNINVEDIKSINLGDIKFIVE